MTDRGTEFCGSLEHHEYELYLAIEEMDHSKTKARHPQTKTCPYCKELVQDDVLVFPHCRCSIFAAELQEKVNRNGERAFRYMLLPGLIILAIIYIVGQIIQNLQPPIH